MERKLIFRNEAVDALGYRRVGNSGLKLPQLGMGTWINFTHAADSEKLVHTAMERGIFHFDTADMYGVLPGWSESLLGQALKRISRSSYVLSTKVHARVGKWPNDGGLSRKHISESCDKSLKRLQTDYIDIYYCHRPDPETPLYETVDALATLKNQGKILYAGISMWPAEQIKEFSLLAKQAGLQIVANQVLYNVVQRPSEDVLQVCKEEGIGLVAYSPLAQGLLSEKYTEANLDLSDSRANVPLRNKWIRNYWQDPAFKEALKAFDILCRQQGVAHVKVALGWLLVQDNVACALCGFRNPAQIADNTSYFPIHLPDSLLEELDEFSERIEV